MTTKVTGCKDCPFLHNYEREPSHICEHPKAPNRVGFWQGGYFNEAEWARGYPEGLYQTVTPNGTYSISLSIEPMEIKEDDNYDPIIPDWCPLKSNPVSVEFDITYPVMEHENMK